MIDMYKSLWHEKIRARNRLIALAVKVCDDHGVNCVSDIELCNNAAVVAMMYDKRCPDETPTKCTINGFYTWPSTFIYLNTDRLLDPNTNSLQMFNSAKSTLLHELAHHIQYSRHNGALSNPHNRDFWHLYDELLRKY